MDYKCGVCGNNLPLVDEDDDMKLYHCGTPSCQSLTSGSEEEQDKYGNYCQAVEEKDVE